LQSPSPYPSPIKGEGNQGGTQRKGKSNPSP